MLSYRDRRLHFEGISLEWLVRTTGTPVFLLSERRLEENYQALYRGLSGTGLPAIIRYCAKTNHERGILRVLAGCGSHLLACHLAEAELALASGFPPDRIAFQRPVLSVEELRCLLQRGITFFHLYRVEDLELFEELAPSQGSLRLSLRLRNDSPGARLSPVNFFSRRLGMTREEALAAAGRIVQCPGLSLQALNFYIGTQRSSPSTYRPLLRRAVKLAGQVAKELGVRIQEVNVGGGIPSPTLERLSPWRLWFARAWRGDARGAEHLESFGRRLALELEEVSPRAGLRPPPSLAAEPGRAIVGNAGILVTRVCAVQERWVFTDASRNFLGESPLRFRRAILPVAQPPGKENRTFHLSGSTLNTLDFLTLFQKIPPVRAGELLVLCDAGAYSISRATRYAGLLPAVYLLGRDGNLRCIRRAEKEVDLVVSMES